MRTIPLADTAGLVGQELGVSDSFPVDQESVNQFADATRDHEWIHVDVERAEREYGGTIAHGYFTLSMLPHLMESAVQLADAGDGLNYGLDKARFTNRVRVGKGIRAPEASCCATRSSSRSKVKRSRPWSPRCWPCGVWTGLRAEP